MDGVGARRARCCAVYTAMTKDSGGRCVDDFSTIRYKARMKRPPKKVAGSPRRAPAVPAPADHRRPETRSFAMTLRQLRAARKLSLQELSALADVSRSMISKIEREEVQPSLDVAVRLAEALGTRLNAMIRNDAYARAVKIERDRQAVVRDPRGRWERQTLSPSFTASRIEVLRGWLAPQQNTGRSISHPRRAEEFICLLSGALRVRLDGESIDLAEGDSLFFEADQGHVLENPGDAPAHYMVVIRY